MKQTETTPLVFRLLPIGGIVAVVVGLVTDLDRSASVSANYTSEPCVGEVNPEVILSREQLAAFLTISERDSKARVQEVLQMPYCYLPNLEIRAGVEAERVVYPLAFDPKTWLVVLYEQEEYAGYQFRFVNQN
ncbi:MAG: hypothetical protein Kow00121_17020 [Elainellaceae cyanobacterium]